MTLWAYETLDLLVAQIMMLRDLVSHSTISHTHNQPTFTKWDNQCSVQLHHLCIIELLNYPILKCMLGYTDDKQLPHKCHLMKLGVQVHSLIISWHECVQYCYEVHAYVT